MFSIIFEQKRYILNENDKFNREKIDFLDGCYSHSSFVTGACDATAAANSYNPDFNFPASRWH